MMVLKANWQTKRQMKRAHLQHQYRYFQDLSCVRCTMGLIKPDFPRLLLNLPRNRTSSSSIMYTREIIDRLKTKCYNFRKIVLKLIGSPMLHTHYKTKYLYGHGHYHIVLPATQES